MEGAFAIARQFAERAFHFDSQAELASGLEACALELGFSYFALLHHVDLRKHWQRMIRIDNYPAGWTERFIGSRLFLEDPVFCASLMTNIGFPWDSIGKLIRVSRTQRQILEAARREGLNCGFTVPAHIPGEAHGSCSFACASARTFSHDCMLAAQLVGSFAFQAARRICCARCPLRLQAVQLTPRQRDCVELVAQGKTDWEIAMILGLKEDSVTKVVDAARRRYDVANRTELVVAALFDGQISFNTVRHWQYQFAPCSSVNSRTSR
ncbi:helix-turn-helix transcriptional regulator [Novosphingobium mathurense]|uniref:LuxR family transcriptional regulator, quorum-sensing system regulator CciR n=1 Tax=Novosphingobium mathurense TaxID=428990 RepID=A0A1U6IL92_9SPHN|nr:LuxR family transcriptional regulator [Novosphingobium mathurense]SLK08780.1 LuxR family transcriptional regulator, quorum-sensing system regulator CciR [Novosphingobium mathurense]